MSEWAASEVDNLRAAWIAKDEDGGDLYVTAEIGRQLGRSKSSVIGKANRIGLPERLSPIIRNGIALRPYARRKSAPPPSCAAAWDNVGELDGMVLDDLETVGSDAIEYQGGVGAKEPKATEADNEATPRSPPPQPVNGPEAARPRKDRPAAPAAPHYSLHECQWTDSAHRPWVFCCEPALIGRPWCAEHARRARGGSRICQDEAA